jgi:hypothetical protein
MTYDEGFVEILSNALPIHEKYGFPGHCDVVSGQLGQQRKAWLSSMNTFHHMGKDELISLIDKGWGIGNHSYSHYVYPYQKGLDLYREVVWSKYTLEDTLGIPVRIFTIPNDSYNYEPVLPLVKQYYMGCVYIDGGLNDENLNLFKINNNMVGSKPQYKFPDNHQKETPYNWPATLRTENLAYEELRGNWLLDTTHAVGEHVGQWHKNISPRDLEKRFEKLTMISNGSIWAAKPDDIIDYILMRRNTTVSYEKNQDNSYTISFKHTPVVGMVNRNLSISLLQHGISRQPKVEIEKVGGEYPVTTRTPEIIILKDEVIISTEVHDGLQIRLTW